MKVTVNGEPRDIGNAAKLADVVAHMTTAARGIAVAVNGTVVPRSKWPATILADDDRIEVLTAVQGG